MRVDLQRIEGMIRGKGSGLGAPDKHLGRDPIEMRAIEHELIGVLQKWASAGKSA